MRTLEVLVLAGSKRQIAATYCDDARVRAVPFDALELELGLLWAGVSESGDTG